MWGADMLKGAFRSRNLRTYRAVPCPHCSYWGGSLLPVNNQRAARGFFDEVPALTKFALRQRCIDAVVG